MNRFIDVEFLRVPTNKKDQSIPGFDLEMDTMNLVRKGAKTLSYKLAWNQEQVNEWIFHSLNPKITELNDSYLDLIQNHKNPAFLLIVSF